MSRTRGFTLIEVCVSVAGMVLITASAMTFVTAAGQVRMRQRAQAQLIAIAGALQEFVRDTGAPPINLDQLAVNPGILGWRGPYIGTSVLGTGNQIGSASAGVQANIVRGDGSGNWLAIRDFRTDPWRNTIVYFPPNAAALFLDGAPVNRGRMGQLISYGADRAAGGPDDITYWVSFVALRDRRVAQTRARLQALNAANCAFISNSPSAAVPGPLWWNVGAVAEMLPRMRVGPPGGYLQGPGTAPASAVDNRDQYDAWGVDAAVVGAAAGNAVFALPANYFYSDGCMVHSHNLISGSENTGGGRKNP